MTTDQDLFTPPPSEPPALEKARRKLEAIESEPPCYLKFDVERTSRSEVYIRVIPGTKPKDVPRGIIEKAARELDDSDWGYGNDHEFSGYNGKEVDADEAETYAVEDATGIEALWLEVARLEAEELKRAKPTECEAQPEVMT